MNFSTFNNGPNINGMQSLWPELNYHHYKETVSLVHLWTQIVGKIRLRKMPWLNHSWHVSLYVTPRGFTTSSVPYEKGIFEIEFDFLQNQLILSTSDGRNTHVELRSQPVAHFYLEVLEKLQDLHIPVQIHGAPNELDPAIPFAEDHREQHYDHHEMQLLWKAFIEVHKVFQEFRARFIGKCSPVHLFWGAFDLAVTRFSGRQAPKHPGGMPNIPLRVMQEAYSHEVSSCGFWPGNEDFPQPAFYAYCYPTPEAFGQQPVEPQEAFFSKEMGEFFLPYAAVSSAADPHSALMGFLQSTYEAAANTGSWDRQALEFDFSDFE